MANGTYRIAKKEHRCQFCGLPIPAGSRYWYETITPWDHVVNEGFSTLKVHVECYFLWCNVADDFDHIFPDDPYTWREMLEEGEIKHE